MGMIALALSSCGGDGASPTPPPVTVGPTPQPTPAPTPTPSPTPPPTTGSVLTYVHVFGLGQGLSAQPNGPIMQANDGNYYGTTRAGGFLNCPRNVSVPCGTIFRMDPAGNVTVLYRFDMVGDQGFRPRGALIQGSDGLLYGLTGSGGPTGGGGTAYRISLRGEIEFLASFGVGPLQGFNPGGGLVEARDGNFYGVTSQGGQFDCPEFRARCGTVFRMTRNGEVTFIYNFTTGTSDGAQPNGPLVEGPDGQLWGATALGGTTGSGTIFKVTLTGELTTLHSFGSTANDGLVPQGTMILASDGNFYGTTVAGGTDNHGTVFRITPAGNYSIIHDFGANGGLASGSGVNQYLFEGSDGQLYGITNTGGRLVNGAIGSGTLFRMSKTGQKQVLFVFGDSSPGQGPYDPDGGVIQGSDGAFYGVLENNGGLGATGPFTGAGALFRFGPPR